MKMLSVEDMASVVNELRGKRFDVLSSGGVTLVDVLGRDQKVVEVARTTSNVDSNGEAGDIGLLRYLIRHAHNTPFEFCIVDLLLEMPMDVVRQHNRHRAFSINEFSTRYSEVPDVNEVTSPDKWRKQSESNRQGSSAEFITTWPEGWEIVHDTTIGMEDYKLVDNVLTCHPVLTPGNFLSLQERKLHSKVSEIYNMRLKFGVAKEQARKDLCLSTYTRLRWTGDLRNLLGYLLLRMDSHAQYEIRQFANVIGEKIVAKLFPTVWQAFQDYEINALKLTALDIEFMHNLLARPFVNLPHEFSEAVGTMFHHESEVWPSGWRGLKNCRERTECVNKMLRLGILKPEHVATN